MTPDQLPKTGLCLDQVSIQLNGVNLVELTAHIQPGEVLSVMGESGSGKSTLLDFIAGFLKPDFSASGKIILNGRELQNCQAVERRIGLMFQSPLLFPHMSVLENLLFALPRTVKGRARRKAIAEEALSEAGLAGFGSRDPATLSGGQQTRAALMRTLLAEPEALLLDEPFSSLDQPRRKDIRQLVFSIARQRRIPALLVTHDPADAEAAGGDVLTLDRV